MKALCLVLLLAAPAAAQDVPAAHPLRTASAVYLAGMLADNASTVYALTSHNRLGNHFLYEQNPLIGWMQARPVTMVVVDSAVEIGAVLAIDHTLGRQHPRLVKVGLLGLAVFRGWLTVQNVRAGYRERHSW